MMSILLLGCGDHHGEDATVEDDMRREQRVERLLTLVAQGGHMKDLAVAEAENLSQEEIDELLSLVAKGSVQERSGALLFLFIIAGNGNEEVEKELGELSKSTEDPELRAKLESMLRGLERVRRAKDRSDE